ncbi:MAG TPA: Ppx/GppA phosphatase family protein [Terriglobales bacterium]|nr:Ppx/GppA phosphatase family protein [Terriglobales bacterium]
MARRAAATLAAIDIGANSVRLSIARFQGRRRKVIHEDREVIRLGASVFQTGALAPDAMAATIKVLRRFRRATEKFGADEVRVVATSALRDAHNARQLIDWVRLSTGWTVEVISGLEEGRLIHLGVTAYGRLRSTRVLLVDLGGGSCEFTISVNGHIRKMWSLSLGAVRLTEEFLPRDPPKKKEIERLRSYIGEQLERIARDVKAAHVQLAVATSGTAATLATLHGARAVPRAAVQQLFRQLAKLGAAGRAKLAGVGPRRAEIVVAGAALFTEMHARFGLRGFRYSPLGLRDGLLAHMAAERERRGGQPGIIDTERWDALLAMGRHYGVDADHAAQVRRLGFELFRGLSRLHQLPREYAEWIGAAAMLHEIGNFINRSGARRHSAYIIAHSEIFGYTPEQRQLIAALVRFQGRPRAGAEEPSLIRAAMVLRLARALDQSRRGAVHSVRARVGATEVTLSLTAARRQGDLEVWALEKESAYFAQVFGRMLAVKLKDTVKP